VSVPSGAGEDGKAVQLDSPVIEGQVRYSLSVLRALRFPRDKAADDTRFQAALAAPHATDDYLFAFDAKDEMQRLPVKVQRVTSEGVIMEFGGQERPALAFAKVYGIVFAELSGAAPDPLPAPLGRVVLHSGEELAGQVVQLSGETLTLKTDEGIQLVTPTPGIARVEFVTDKLVYLSSLEPSKVEQVPAFDRTWPWLVDRAPAGPTIVLAGSEYNRGLVLFPRTRLEYDVGGKFDHFEATVGIEDRAGPQAHAIFRVLADGKEIYASEPLTVGAVPQILKLPIEGVARVAIEADFGKNFDLGDHCVFAEARVTQK